MIVDKLTNYHRNWIIGNFEPAMLTSEHFEIAVHRNTVDDIIIPHYQKTATEYTIIISGSIFVGGHTLGPDDVFVWEPNEVCDGKFLEDTVTVVIKTPSVGIEDKVNVDD